MAGARQSFTISDGGPGGKAPGGFLEAVVAFIVALFHPIVQLFSVSPKSSTPCQDHDHRNNRTTTAAATNGKDDDSRKMQATTITIPTGASSSVNGSNDAGSKNDMANGAAIDRQLTDAVDRLKINNDKDDLEQKRHNEDEAEELTLPPPVEPIEEEPEDPIKAAERMIHTGFMNQALDMARLALKTNETPVGCVLVQDGRVIAKGMNATNVTRNGTRHAELMALTALLSYTPKSDVEVEKPKKTKRSKKRGGQPQPTAPAYTDADWGDIDPKDGHIYPYGQKLHPSPKVDKNVIKESILYVTVEPCVMCASMLRQFGIRKVFFGAVNDKFGGTGGVFCIHMNSDPADAVTAPASPTTRPANGQILRPPLAHKPASCAPKIPVTNKRPTDDGENKDANGDEQSKVHVAHTPPPIPVSNISVGHGGNVEDGFEAEGGWGRDEAVNLLRQFYVQENGRAPQPRKKEGRAARLAAMMEGQGMSVEGTPLAGASINGGSDTEQGNSEMPTPAAVQMDGEAFDVATAPQLLPTEVTAA